MMEMEISKLCFKISLRNFYLIFHSFIPCFIAFLFFMWNFYFFENLHSEILLQSFRSINLLKKVEIVQIKLIETYVRMKKN